VTKNVAENMAAVDHAPRSRGHQTVLRGCVAYLAEILALANVGVAAFGSDFESIVEDASASYVKFGRDIKKMSAELEARYAGISERVGDPDILLREADAHVMEVDMTVPDITAPVYERLLDSVGEINSMWRAYSSDKHMKEAVKAGRHRPMNDTNADELRTGLVHMFKEVNRSFNSGGLVSELLMATAAMRYRAGVSISQADAHSEADIRNDRKGLYESRDEYAARVAKGIADVPQERFRTRSDGASTMAKANLIGGFLSDVQASLHPDLERASMVSFRRFAEGILVGRISGLDDAIVISRDKEVGERDAVWVARIPHAAIVGGFDNSKAKEFDGTNFYSVDDALQEIGTDRFQEMFFDGHKIDGHDGFDLLAEERRVIRKSIANGRDISSFPEYDGTSARTRAL
jgi:hypothetical protein